MKKNTENFQKVKKNTGQKLTELTGTIEKQAKHNVVHQLYFS